MLRDPLLAIRRLRNRQLGSLQLSTILEKRTRYQCVTAMDGLEAVTKANEEHPELVLMDVVMPRMNGFEACKKMRESLRLERQT